MEKTNERVKRTELEYLDNDRDNKRGYNKLKE